MSTALQKAQKEFPGEVRKASEKPQIETVSSGIPSLDEALDIGGYPIGGLVEIFGPEAAGKSVLSFLAMAEVQATGREVALIDYEGTFNAKWAAYFGLDPDRCHLYSPLTAERCVKHLVSCVQNPDYGMTVLDSVGAMASEKELDDDGKRQAYGQSGLITSMVKKSIPHLLPSRQILLLINQVRDVQVGMHTKLESPGGHALKHAASVRIQLRGGTSSNKKEVNKEEVGFRPTATVLKSKIGSPKRVAEWDFYHTDSPLHPVGIDLIESAVSVALNRKIITREGAWYYYGEHKWNGRDRLNAYMKEHPELVLELKGALRA